MRTNVKRLFAIILALALLCSCLPTSALAAEPENLDYQYTSNEDSNIQETDVCAWRNCFTRSSFLGCDHLKLLSAQAAIASASYYGSAPDPYEQDCGDMGYNINNLLTALGFEDVETNAWYQTETLENSAAVAVGHRTVHAAGKAYTLLAIIPRSACYKQEWAGNFTVGDGMMHEGFKAARDEDLRFVKQYIGDHGITGDLKVWITGHSRGAAVANLLGGFFAGGGIDYFGGNVSITPEDVYCYTFATPRTVIPGLEKNEELSVAGNRGGAYAQDTVQEPYAYTGGASVDPTDSIYSGIRNYPFDYDFITYLPPAQWGFTYYGSVFSMTETLDGVSITPEEMLAELEAVNAYVYRVWTGGAMTGDLADYPGDYRGFRAMDFDLASLSVYAVDADVNLDMSGFIASFIGGLPELIPTKGEYRDAGYEEIMIALAGLYGMIVVQFGDQLEEGVTELLIPAVLCCLSCAYESMRTENPGIAEAEAAFAALTELAEHVTGKKLPGELSTLTMDDLVALMAKYISDHEDSPLVRKLLGLLLPIIPEEYAGLLTLLFSNAIPGYNDETTTLEEAILCYLHACAYGPLPGSVWAEDEDFSDITCEEIRWTLYGLLSMIGLPEEVSEVISYDGSGRASDLMAALLPLLMGSDEDGVPYPSLAAAADAGLRAGLKTLIDGVLASIDEKNLAYSDAFVQDIVKHERYLLDPENPQRVTLLRNVLCSLLLRTDDGSFNAAQVVQRIATFVGNISRIPPAHYNEVFIAWAKAAAAKGPMAEDIAPTVSISDWAWGEAPSAPAVFGNPGGEVTYSYAPKGSETFSAAVPTAPGVYTVKAAIEATHDYNSGEATVDFTIYAPVYVYDDPVTPSTPAETVTVPVSGEDATVNVTVEIKGDTAIIKEADIDKVLEAEDVGTVTIDVSSLEETVTEVVIPNALLTKIADAAADEDNDTDGLEIRLPAGSVTFDAEAMAAIAEQADGEDLTFNLEAVKVSELSPEQQEAVGDLEVEVVLDAYLTSGGERISDFRGGSAAISIPFTLKDNQTAAGLVIWYVAEDGTRTQVPATYDGENILFTVPHFSNYVIAYDKSKPAACPKDETCPLSAYTDLDTAEWYHDGVHWALENGFMEGYGDGIFKPTAATSRAMIVTILYRLEGEPAVDSLDNPFDDVAEGKWYTDAVLWASENKIVEGYGDGTFRPTVDITREQLATILYRYAQSKGQGFRGMWIFLLDYPDAAEISSWADEAMHWCVMNGIVGGKDGKLVPGGDASRAEAATMLMRYCTKIAE